MRPLNPEFNARLKKLLRENKRAIQYLSSRGITAESIEYFNLGLSAPYRSKKSGQEHADALVYPLRGPDGKFYNKYGYHDVPGVTRKPLERNGWTSGEARTYYASPLTRRRLVFVCQGALDLWRHWQALYGTALGGELLLVCSTREAGFPEEWKEPKFWAGWETVFIGFDGDEAGEVLAAALAEVIGRDARRARVPARYGKEWTDFWQGGADNAEFTRLLRDAPVCSVPLGDESEASRGYGRFAYRPVNINGAFHNGHLYYPVQILNRAPDVNPEGVGGVAVRDVERLETVIVRSDRTVHSAVVAPAPKGTRERERVMRLTDGTLIDGEPQANKYGTWSWPSIKTYLDGKAMVRPLADILRDVMSHLKASVWLPNEEDYALLTLTVPVTYAQAVFDSVPLILLTGPAGSGKSEMGRAMAAVCANAYVCGQSSAASIARFIHESRGFVVLDDLEGIGGRGGQFNDLVQALKLSYNKATAVKLWTDVKTMRTHRLDFYGVKMINNTRGASDILGSRMLKIQTRRIPEWLRGEFGELPLADGTRLGLLRDELHIWTFENVCLIESMYRACYPKTTDRPDEIVAPLKVIATIAGDALLSSQLELALTRQGRRTPDADNPKALVGEALKNIVALGYDMVSPTHLSLEIRRLLSPVVGDMPEWVRPIWVGRMLRSLGVVDEDIRRSKKRRTRVYGLNLRFYHLSSSYLSLIKEEYVKRGTELSVGSRQPTAFCEECDSCPYSTLDCEIMLKRQSSKKSSGHRFLRS
jgi:hypothetical protein